MATFGLQLGYDDVPEYYPVLIEPRDRRCISEQDTGIEHIRASTLGFDHADSPGPRALTRHPDRTQTCRTDRAALRRAAPALPCVHEARRFEGLPGRWLHTACHS